MKGSGRSAIVLSGSLAMIGSVLQGTATVAVQYREDIAGRVFQRLGGRGYDDSVPGDDTKTTPSGDRTT